MHLISCLTAATMLVAIVFARPIDDNRGTWEVMSSQIRRPPYEVPNIPRDLPDDFFDQFEHSEELSVRQRNSYNYRYRVWRMGALEDIARQYPVTAPPERVVRVYLQGGYKKIERNVKLTIARRLKAKSTPKTKEQLEADLAKALKNRNKLIAKACRLRQEVADCDEAAAEEEERIQDLRKQLEALENGSNGGGSGSQNNLQHDSRNELSIEGVGPVKHSLNLVEKGAASLCQGADRLFQRVGSAVNRPGVGGVGIPGAVFKPSLIRAY